MSNHLGLAVTAFIDGELDHTRREEVLAHLTHCTACREEVEGLRVLKAALRSAAPTMPTDLTARLMAAAAAPVAPERVAHVRRRPRHGRVRRAAMSGALVALGLGGALSLAGPPPKGPVAPVDPTNAGFVRDHGATSGEVPFTELDVVSVSSTSTAGPTP
jgi:anti-sigma factor RsiW